MLLEHKDGKVATGMTTNWSWTQRYVTIMRILRQTSACTGRFSFSLTKWAILWPRQSKIHQESTFRFLMQKMRERRKEVAKRPQERSMAQNEAYKRFKEANEKQKVASDILKNQVLYVALFTVQQNASSFHEFITALCAVADIPVLALTNLPAIPSVPEACLDPLPRNLQVVWWRESRKCKQGRGVKRRGGRGRRKNWYFQQVIVF